uniref:MAGE domain-containing protein n=1 Tax=Loxodonta africana TaxID=9785 RepID=G3UKF8_LOXAF
DPLTKEVDTLVQLVLQTYKLKKLVIKEDMLKIVNKKYKSRFHEILRRASFSTEVVFGIDLKEIDSVKPSYALVSKMDLPNDGRLSRGRGLPKTGVLMILLGVIFMKGNCASEEKIWEFLNKMRIFAGKRHFIFGEPRKLITQDFVKLKYLEYRQVPNSDPPSYEFLWGPRAHAETSKMKTLEFLAKINDTVPSALPSLCEEALRVNKEKVRKYSAIMAFWGGDPLTRRVTMLLQFLLSKYEMREHITKGKMLKIINKRYKEHFPEILRRASKCIELVFGLDVKEVDSKGQSYTIVSKLEITEEEKLSGGRGIPKTGILMPLLSMIYKNGNRATEEKMWEFLNVFGMYDGEPRKLITKDLVQAKYLEYRQVPNSDPPRYEFLWGPEAQAEASKTKVLEFLAKVKDTNSSALQALYKETWGDEEETASGREWAGAC